MTNEEAIKCVDDRMCYGRGQWSEHHQPVIDEYWQAGELAMKALKKQIATQPTEKTEGIIKCASCGRTLCKPKYGKKSNYCATCGQKICWDMEGGDATCRIV